MVDFFPSVVRDVCPAVLDLPDSPSFCDSQFGTRRVPLVPSATVTPVGLVTYPYQRSLLLKLSLKLLPEYETRRLLPSLGLQPEVSGLKPETGSVFPGTQSEDPMQPWPTVWHSMPACYAIMALYDRVGYVWPYYGPYHMGT